MGKTEKPRSPPPAHDDPHSLHPSQEKRYERKYVFHAPAFPPDTMGTLAPNVGRRKKKKKRKTQQMETQLTRRLTQQTQKSRTPGRRVPRWKKVNLEKQDASPENKVRQVELRKEEKKEIQREIQREIHGGSGTESPRIP